MLFLVVVFFSCEKETSTRTETISGDTEFIINYGGQGYKGTAELKLNPETGNPKYKNFLLVSTTDFTLFVFNIPNKGTAILNSGLYNASEGDVAMTYTKGNNEAVICSGSIKRLTERSLSIQSKCLDKSITGTVKW